VIIKNWQKSIDSVVKWAEDRGINVCFGKDLEDQFCYKERVIHINTNQTKENRFYVLLHECGHYLISKTSSNFVRDMPMYKGFTGGEDGRVLVLRLTMCHLLLKRLRLGVVGVT